MSGPPSKKQLSASKLVFPGYFDWLKNLKGKVAEIQKYIDDNDDVPLNIDQSDAFRLMKDQVAAFEKDAPSFGKNWSRFSSSQSESKASQILTRLTDYKDLVQFSITTTRKGIQKQLQTLQEAINTAGKSTTPVVLVMEDGVNPDERKEYTIEVELREVNRGAFGTVHIGKCADTGREFALKRPILVEEGETATNDDATRRFLREASIWSTLKHEHILPYCGKVEVGDAPYLVSPYIRDGDLLQYLGNNPLKSRSQILYDIASALAYMHGQDPPVIHADVKSGNILIDSTGHTYICDFGLTKFGNAVTTVKGVGTLYWLSPERLDGGESTRTTQDDVYAFGITIAEVVLGRVPYESFRGTDSDFKTGVMWRQTRPTGGSGPLWELACKCWQHDPNSRPTMAEVTAELLVIRGNEAEVS